jgi:hypothetical protein
MLTTYFRSRVGQTALLKRTLNHTQSAKFSSNDFKKDPLVAHDYNKDPLVASIDLTKVNAFGKEFLWNETLFERLDQ